MKKSRLLAVSGSVALVASVLAMAWGVSLASHALSPYTSQHANSATINNDSCIACHGNKKVESSPAMQAGEPNVSAHKKHSFSVLLKFAGSDGGGVGDTSLGCANCHQKTATGYEGDLSYTDGAVDKDLRKTVEPAKCVGCHGKFRLTASGGNPAMFNAHYTNSDSLQPPVSETNPRGCTNCHVIGGGGTASDPAAAHSNVGVNPGAAFINTLYTSSSTYCLICHGGKAWFQVDETN